MRSYTIEQQQFLPVSPQGAWNFFSCPENLLRITPPEMHLKMTSGNEHEKIFAGQVLTYSLRPVLRIRTSWTSEIVQADAPHFFVDEQRNGPYRFWRHEHRFTPEKNGTLMHDHLRYALPLGPLGTIAHVLFVKKKLEANFRFRKEMLARIFA